MLTAMNRSDSDLKAIFYSTFKKLQEISINNNVSREIDERRHRVFDKNRGDSYFYEILVRDIHNAGMKATVVTSKWPSIREAFLSFDINKVANYSEKDFEKLMANPKIIRHEKKLRACILNAKTILALSQEFGSFGEYLNQYKDDKELNRRLASRFMYVGETVASDYLKDIGIDFIKPDVHVLRVLFRLGFVNSEDLTNATNSETVKVAEAFRKATSEKLSVIDGVFWMYGGGGDGHAKKAICNKNNPYCNECPLTIHCRYS
jgi:DNA-3-methyladenine glycosylase I